MKRAFIICLTVSFLLSIVFMFAGCKPARTEKDPEGTNTNADSVISGGESQDGEEWIDVIDSEPPVDETTAGEQPTEPESTSAGQDGFLDSPETDGGNKPTDPPVNNGGDKPTDPPVTDGTDQATDPPAQDTTKDNDTQTTNGGIELPAIPG